jgi:hypothetical protein
LYAGDAAVSVPTAALNTTKLGASSVTARRSKSTLPAFLQAV